MSILLTVFERSLPWQLKASPQKMPYNQYHPGSTAPGHLLPGAGSYTLLPDPVFLLLSAVYSFPLSLLPDHTGFRGG
jgi:hypothetical protein